MRWSAGGNKSPVNSCDSGIRIALDIAAPQSNHKPSSVRQSAARRRIARLVAGYLAIPVRTLCSEPEYGGVTMPKLSVNENRNFPACKGQVRPAGQGAYIDTIATDPGCNQRFP
jgi:hypothetical protein